MKWEQVWYQIKNTAAGLQLMTSLEADEMGASAAPGKKHCSRVTTDGKFRSGRNWSKCGVKITTVGLELMEQMC